MNPAVQDDTALDAIHYSRGCGKFDNKPEQRVADDFAGFRHAVLTDVSPRKGMGYICAPCTIADDTEAHRTTGSRADVSVVGMHHRCALCAQGRGFIGLDLDKVAGMVALTDLCGWMQRSSAFAYTTASHAEKAPRARVIIETNRAMNRDECMVASAAFRARIVAQLGDRFGFDAALDRPEQPIYTPTTGAYSFVFDGESVNVDELLADAAPAKPARGTARSTDDVIEVSRETLADLRSALTLLDADDRPTWIKVTACLRELGDAGRGLWLEWSQGSPKWRPTDAQTWNTQGHDRAGHTGVIRAAMDAGWRNPRAGSGARSRTDKRTRIVVRKGRINEAVDAAEAAMIEHAAPLYARGEVLMRLATGIEHAHLRRAATAPVLTPATPPMLREEMERCARFVAESVSQETGETKTRTVDCPGGAPSVYLGRVGGWRVPQVVAVTEAPIIRADGEIVFSGYDAREQVLIVAPGVWPHVAAQPTKVEALAALHGLSAIIADYAFVAPCDRAVTLAAFLTAIARPTLRSSPAFGWTAPVRGSGKSKLADVAAILANNRPAAAMAWPAQDEEAEKRIGAVILAGDAVLLIDNIEAPIRSPVLNSLLTQETVAVRILGKSQIAKIGTRALLLMTGNNLCIQGDATRRVLVAEIDPRTERPELRSFPFDPVARARRERRALVAACLTVLRYGVTLPQQAAVLGSFEDWSRRVRDPLIALGAADPCECLTRLMDADPEREAALELLGAWHSRFGSTPTSVAAAIRDAELDRAGALYESIAAVAGGQGGLNSRRLGRYLAKIKDRMFGASAFRQGRDWSAHSAAWHVEVRRPMGFAA